MSWVSQPSHCAPNHLSFASYTYHGIRLVQAERKKNNAMASAQLHNLLQYRVWTITSLLAITG